MPDAPAFRNVAAFGGVDGIQMTHDFAVFGVLPVGDVDFVVVNHRRADHFIARLGPHGLFGIQIERTELHAAQRFVAANPAIALADYNLHHIADLAHRG